MSSLSTTTIPRSVARRIRGATPERSFSHGAGCQAASSSPRLSAYCNLNALATPAPCRSSRQDASTTAI